MNYSVIRDCDVANGPGIRVSIFVSGCRNKCPGCFNKEAWDFKYGKKFDMYVLRRELHPSLNKEYVDGITILGGEPLEPENSTAVYGLTDYVRSTEFAGNKRKSIWLYTGFTYEDLISGNCRAFNGMNRRKVIDKILENIDVLVDGPFIEKKKDISLKFRGSSNQRIIDMIQTRMKNKIVLWKE